MKPLDENNKTSIVEEAATPYMRHFSSQEEAERFNMIQNIERSDMEKFNLFCNMLRRQKMYSQAKIYNYSDLK